MTGQSASAQPTSLLRDVQDSGSFPAMERVSDRFARGLKDYLAAFGEPMVETAAMQIMPYESWQAARAADVLLQFRVPQKKLAIHVAMPQPMLLAMLDRFYGGNGAHGIAREELTAAERRFAERVGNRLAAVIAGAWSTVLPMQPVLGTITIASNATPPCAPSDLALEQNFALTGAGFDDAVVRCAYPLAALRAVLGQCGEGGAVDGADAEWSARINTAALNVRLPVRTIFARPEISFATLLALQPGDIIPLLLPQHVPITVAGRHFALGNIGEANGRAAIRIEKMKEGFAQ